MLSCLHSLFRSEQRVAMAIAVRCLLLEHEAPYPELFLRLMYKACDHGGKALHELIGTEQPLNLARAPALSINWRCQRREILHALASQQV